jgi:hypothetical protein
MLDCVGCLSFELQAEDMGVLIQSHSLVVVDSGYMIDAVRPSALDFFHLIKPVCSSSWREPCLEVPFHQTLCSLHDSYIL